MTDSMKLAQSQLEHQIYGIAILAIEFHTRKKIYAFTDRFKLGLQKLEHQIQGIVILAIEFHPRAKSILCRTLLNLASHS